MKSIIFFCLTLSVSYASLCTDLTGRWRNQLNSNMTIENGTGKTITGRYYTAVESSRGASAISSKISGIVESVENGKLIGFNVLWNRGASLTAWVGQCIVCDGKEKLHTTWVLRSYMPAKKRWMTSRINQDTFWRVDDEEEHQHQVTPPSTVGENAQPGSEIRGKWVSPSGDSFEIEELQEQLGTWTGKHYEEEETAVSLGRYDGNQTYTAVGFVCAAHHKIRGWTGHINDPQATVKVVETTWLEHTFHHSCSNPRKLVRFGMDNYSHSQS